MRLKGRNRFFYAGLVITGVVLLLVLLGIVYMPYDPTALNAEEKLQGISLRHIMGTDNMGRDIFSRVLYGSRITLLIATGTVFLGATVGVLIGAFTGYFGGVLDEVLMRIMDALFAFPSILLALVFVSLFGTGTWQLMLALGVAFIPSFSRIVRSEFLRCKNADYVKSAKLQGAGSLRIMFWHILPNCKNVILSAVLIGFNNAVLAEAGLSFLGIGAQPPYASLGKMLSDAQQYMMTLPVYVLGPGLMIFCMVIGFSFLGEGVRE